jgi:hypothetical protein
VSIFKPNAKPKSKLATKGTRHKYKIPIITHTFLGGESHLEIMAKKLHSTNFHITNGNRFAELKHGPFHPNPIKSRGDHKTKVRKYTFMIYFLSLVLSLLKRVHFKRCNGIESKLIFDPFL